MSPPLGTSCILWLSAGQVRSCSSFVNLQVAGADLVLCFLAQTTTPSSCLSTPCEHDQLGCTPAEPCSKAAIQDAQARVSIVLQLAQALETCRPDVSISGQDPNQNQAALC